MIPGFAPDHPSWVALKAEIEKRIAAGRDTLETPSLDTIGTAQVRGEIVSLRRLVADIEEKPVEVAPTPGYDQS